MKIVLVKQVDTQDQEAEAMSLTSHLVEYLFIATISMETNMLGVVFDNNGHYKYVELGKIKAIEGNSIVRNVQERIIKYLYCQL